MSLPDFAGQLRRQQPHRHRTAFLSALSNSVPYTIFRSFVVGQGQRSAPRRLPRPGNARALARGASISCNVQKSDLRWRWHADRPIVVAGAAAVSAAAAVAAVATAAAAAAAVATAVAAGAGAATAVVDTTGVTGSHRGNESGNASDRREIAASRLRGTNYMREALMLCSFSRSLVMLRRPLCRSAS